MAIPTSPSVVVRENDVSIYTPNINSSVVGLVGFATKGPVNKPTLITSQNNLLQTFGKPDASLNSQLVAGALEILEATDQVYVVRGAAASAEYASAMVAVGACPAVKVEGYIPRTDTSAIEYTIYDNNGTQKAKATVEFASSTDYTTDKAIFLNAFNPDLVNQQNVFAFVEGNDIYLASRFAGSGATMTVSGNTGFVFSGLDVLGDAIVAGAGAQYTASGYTASSVELEVRSIYEGTGYNLSSLRDGSTRGLSFEVNNVSVKDQITVNSDGAAVEAFDGIDLITSSNTFSDYVMNSDIDATQSEYVVTNLQTTAGDDYAGESHFGAKAAAAGFVGNDSSQIGTPRFVKLIEGTYGLAGGTNGADDVTDLIGTENVKTGMYALDNDGLNLGIALVPGVTDQRVQNALITIAETSKNFLALVAPPEGQATVQDAVDWMNGAAAGDRDSAINSSYAAVYWPWVQVFNNFAGADDWYDPTIFAARQCVFTDAISDPWFAPAGFRRGRLTKATDTEISLNQGDKDVLYSNSINPITNDRATGITIFGQRTAQRAPTALDRVNVRRLMIYIRKVLLDLGKPFQFEPNDEFTWEQVEDSINPFLSDLLARRAIVQGAVRCDSTTNTPARVDRNELWCSISITPTKAAETIVFEVNLTSQAATING